MNVDFYRDIGHCVFRCNAAAGKKLKKKKKKNKEKRKCAAGNAEKIKIARHVPIIGKRHKEKYTRTWRILGYIRISVPSTVGVSNLEERGKKKEKSKISSRGTRI